jgi:hypothetical protein
MMNRGYSTASFSNRKIRKREREREREREGERERERDFIFYDTKTFRAIKFHSSIVMM